jgi:hypothetical protein
MESTTPPTELEPTAPAATIKEESAATGTLGRLADLGWQTLPAIAGTLGFVGFVALVGGAMERIRFSAAGLPADQGVRVVPKSELVAIGAVSLVGFTVLALLALLVVYLLDRQGDATVPTLRGLIALTVTEMLVTLIFIRVRWWVYVLIGVWLVLVGVLAGRTLARIPGRLRDQSRRRAADEQLRSTRLGLQKADDALADARYRLEVAAAGAARAAPPSDDASWREAAVERRRAELNWERALRDWLEVHDARSESDRERTLIADLLRRSEPPSVAELEELFEQAGRPRGWWTAFKWWWDETSTRQKKEIAALLVIFSVGLGLVLGFPLTRWLAIIFAVVLFLGAATFGVARATTRFAWYGVAVFLSVILFGTALGIARTLRSPKVQPVALVRKSDDTAICGVYITQTDKRVYIGRVQPDGSHAQRGSGRIFWVPANDVDVVSVGSLQSIASAEKRARYLMQELYHDRAQEAAATVKPTTRTKVVERKPGGTAPSKTTTTVSETPVKAERPAVRPEPPLPDACSDVTL